MATNKYYDSILRRLKGRQRRAAQMPSSEGNSELFRKTRGESNVPEDLIAFIGTQAPKAKYILSICGGATYLAFAGFLSGKKATTNKAFYRPTGIKFDLTDGFIEAATPKDIKWVAKARWVVDGWQYLDQLWRYGRLRHGPGVHRALVGPHTARVLRGAAEIRNATQEDDPFAEFHGLV
ncbi:hypothetical protein B0H14DRAFT_2615663 [Mycena olivaceomarginata]|nr:hypothetical protein B0H14DRAFT_2615663 [Mycena olivaceomarginata]